MSTILEKIVADKYVEVCLLKQDKPLCNFHMDIVPSDRDFYASLAASKPAYILEFNENRDNLFTICIRDFSVNGL